MNHTNTIDNIRISTSTTADIHVVSTYQLLGKAEQKNDYTAITTATDTDLSFPDAGESRIVNLTIKNAHASTANVVTVSKYYASVAYQIIQATLAAGESLVYDGNGWRAFTATGKLKVEVGSGGGSTAWGGITGTLSDQTDLQSALDSKEPTISSGTSGQYWRGDKTWQTLDKTAVGLGNVDNTSDATKNSATATLTNKRITKRIGSTTSSATPSINTDNVDGYHLTAQAADITSFTTNLSGTPTDGQLLMISVTGTAARAITWGASFAAGAVDLPTTTTTTERLDTLFKWSSVASKWMAMASGSYADS